MTLFTARVYVFAVFIKEVFNNKPNFPENSKSCCMSMIFVMTDETAKICSQSNHLLVLFAFLA